MDASFTLPDLHLSLLHQPVPSKLGSRNVTMGLPRLVPLLVLESHWGIVAAMAAAAAFSLSLPPSLSGFGNGTHSEGMSISKLVDRPQCIGQGFSNSCRKY